MRNDRDAGIGNRWSPSALVLGSQLALTGRDRTLARVCRVTGLLLLLNLLSTYPYQAALAQFGLLHVLFVAEVTTGVAFGILLVRAAGRAGQCPDRPRRGPLGQRLRRCAAATRQPAVTGTREARAYWKMMLVSVDATSGFRLSPSMTSERSASTDEAATWIRKSSLPPRR